MGENGLDLESLDTTIGELNRAVAGMNQTVEALERLTLSEDANPFDRLLRVGASLILFFFLTALATVVAYRLILKRMIGV